MAKRKPSAGSQKNIINNMGLFWRRENVRWRGNRTFGKPTIKGVRVGAKLAGEVDFWNQVGIYALYTSDYHLVYVGQAGIGDQACIGKRLKHHTRDDLAGRWDLFSWFGLRKVKGNNQLGVKFERAHPTWLGIANILEGVLIEVAEPPMNNQKGRFGKGVHRYLQSPLEQSKEDLAKKLDGVQKTLQRIEKKVGKL